MTTVEKDLHPDEQSESFEELFRKSSMCEDSSEIGSTVTGTILSISDDSVFVDIAGKSDAIINISECTDDKGDVYVKPGDTIHCYIAQARSGEIFITQKIGLGYFSQDLLETAYKNSLPVYGRVIATTKGGFTISFPGVHCFCPMSQIDIKSPSNPNLYVDKILQFKITEYSDRGKKIILSRRTLLDEQRGKREDELKQTLHQGDRIHGTVQSIQAFGLFVDIGGMQALVPKSEISWSRYTDIASFAIGDRVEAKVKSIDWENKKITLSIKEILPDPWSSVNQYAIGEERSGKVRTIIKSGAFVELAPGLEGFIHISNMSTLKKIHAPEDAVSKDSMVTVRIIAIIPDTKRISLELVTSEADPWQLGTEHLVNSIHEATIESAKSAGISARLANGMLGFIPREELRSKKSADIQQSYPVGNAIKVTIMKIDPKSKKMILTEEGAVKKAEKDEYERYMKNEADTQGLSLGSLFKNKFDKIKKDIDK